MPTIPQQQTIVQYIANSSQTQYTFAFYAFNQANINVYYQASNATPIPSADILTLGSQYTVTFNADPTTGGYITLLFTPTSGYYLTIVLNLIPSLNTNFANAQNFNGANLDAALDYLFMLCQQNLNYAQQRNLSYVVNTYLPSYQPYTQLPPLPQNYFWVGSGNGIVAAQIATIPSASVLQSMLANNAPGTDGALLVGYYNATTSTATTVDAQLTRLISIGTTISSNIDSGSAVSLTSNMTGTITSISLSAGQWLVWGLVGNIAGSGTISTSFFGAISTTAVFPTVSPTGGSVSGSTNNPSNANQELVFALSPIILTLVSTAPIYLLANSTFSVSTQSAYGYIAATKISGS